MFLYGIQRKEKLLSFDEALDYQIYQKILPRLAGSDGRTEEVLKQLYILCANEEYDSGNNDASYAKYPRSANKLSHMLRRFEYDGFTSSGSNNEIELVKIETEELSLTIKGNPYHEKYESLKEYHAMNVDEMMYFHVDGETESVSVFDARLQRLDEWNEHPPIFLRIEVISLLLFRKRINSSLLS